MQACPFDKFCLGMCDWTDCPGRQANSSTERPALTTPNRDVDDALRQLPHPDANNSSASGSHTQTTGSKTSSTLERFSTFVDDDKLAILSKGVVPVNTDRNTKWALSNFFAWKEARDKSTLKIHFRRIYFHAVIQQH